MSTLSPSAKLFCSLLASLVAFQARAQAHPDLEEEEGRALFLTHCATCHGEEGDGKGVTELDRPARSFKDGGFSFGDTKEAIVRTLKSGIPGSPMPSFAGTVTDAELLMLAEYVLTLVPERRVVNPSAMELKVTGKPMIIRGLLPPISSAATGHPRGLLVGTTEGLTFEWRTDDVRLLGIRQGAFVDRSDWIGRGGAALKPLGKVVYLLGQGAPEAPFRLLPSSASGGVTMAPTGEALRCQLLGSWVRGLDAGLRYALETQSGERIAVVEDSARALGTSVGSGFMRSLSFEGGPRAAKVAMNAANSANAGTQSFTTPATREGGTSLLWQITALDDGLFQCAALHWPPTGTDENGPFISSDSAGANLFFNSDPGRAGQVNVSVVITTEWDAEVRAALELEVAR